MLRPLIEIVTALPLATSPDLLTWISFPWTLSGHDSSLEDSAMHQANPHWLGLFPVTLVKLNRLSVLITQVIN